MQNKRIRFFSSAKEQEEEMLAYSASLTPAERLAYLYESNKRAFNLTDERLKELKIVTRIRFTHIE